MQRIEWHAASEIGTRHGPPNQDVAWWSGDGRLCLVADGGYRPGQEAHLASATCARLAGDLYDPDAGDELTEHLVRATNSDLLRRVAADEPVGTTTLAVIHASASGRVLGSVMGDSGIFRVRQGEDLLIVRPLRKFDYYCSESVKRAEADALFEGLPWWMRVSLTSQLPWASQGIAPTLTDLAPAPGDTLIVCSDGGMEGFRIDELTSLAARYEPSVLPTELIRRARSAGSSDDATILVARWPTFAQSGRDHVSPAALRTS